MDQKDSMSGRVDMTEVANEGEVANESGVAPQQKTTTFMVLFSLYIGLAGWIYNFDLGQITFLPPFEHI